MRAATQPMSAIEQAPLSWPGAVARSTIRKKRTNGPVDFAAPKHVRGLAAHFHLEARDVERFLSDYRTTVAAFPPLGGIDTFLPTLTAFQTWWRRLHHQDGILLSLCAAGYQLAEWAATPVWRFSESRVYAPAFPEDWVKRTFLHAPAAAPLSLEQHRRFNQLQEDWEAGAAKMRETLMTSLHRSYTGSDPAVDLEFTCFEDLVRLQLMVSAGCRAFTYAASRGFAVANHFYRSLKTEMEHRAKMSLPGELIPYPSTRLNYGA